jgi:hypothetical protein
MVSASAKRVHDGGQHAHVVGRGAVHADRATRHTAEDVAAADDHSHLDTQARDLGHLFNHAHNGGAVDAKCVVTHQGLTGQLEQNTLVGWCGDGHDRRLMETD